MASEVLAIPEEHLEAVVRVIREGCRKPGIAPLVVKRQLRKWCVETEDYLRRQKEP